MLGILEALQVKVGSSSKTSSAEALGLLVLGVRSGNKAAVVHFTWGQGLGSGNAGEPST